MRGFDSGAYAWQMKWEKVEREKNVLLRAMARQQEIMKHYLWGWISADEMKRMVLGVMEWSWKEEEKVLDAEMMSIGENYND